MHVHFYTRRGCHLCDEAKLMLKLVAEDYPLTWTEVDIEEDEEYHEKYMLMIPVIESEGTVVLYGSFGYVDIVEMME